MRLPDTIMIDGDRKDLSWIKERTSVANYLNVPKSIAISGRVINIEWIRRAYAKEPDKMRERFIFCVVQELLRTVSFRQACEYRGIVTDTISRGLHPFLKKYAHLMFNPDTAYPYRTLVDLPDRVEIDGQFWWMGCFKRPDVSSKSAISGLISRVAEVCLKRNPSIHLDFAEIKCLADSFASKFCRFLELNAEDLFGKKPIWDTEAIPKPMEKSIADAQSELYVLTEDFKELRKGVGELIRRVRMVEEENESLLDQNAALKQKVEVLSSENKLLRTYVAAIEEVRWI